MKKIFTVIIILGLCAGIFFVGKNIYEKKAYTHYIEEVKKEWHVEILTETLNVREHATKYSNSLKTVSAGEVYKVLEFSEDEAGNYYWYKIEFYDGSTGWVANNTKGTYLKDVGNENDVAIPIIQYSKTTLSVVSIKDINPDKLVKSGDLIVWDDRDDYEITYTVYYEEHPIDKDTPNWWIKWKIEDKSGKSSSKLQKVSFEQTPTEGYDLFENCTRDNGKSC